MQDSLELRRAQALHRLADGPLHIEGLQGVVVGVVDDTGELVHRPLGYLLLHLRELVGAHAGDD